MAKRKYICPNCRKKTGADILYGMPAWEMVEKEVEEGYLVIGGGCQLIDGPERECTECEHQWRIKRRKPDPMTQFDDCNDPSPQPGTPFHELLECLRHLTGTVLGSGFEI